MQVNWTEILGWVFEFLVFPLLGLATAHFISWTKAKKQEILEKTKDETTKKYLDMLDKTVTDCVLATKQTYVDALKKEGAFDAEAQKHAFQMSYDAVMALLTDEAEMYINEVVKDLNAYITTKIEAQVSATK